jgi:hypothetical protein
MDCSGPQVVSTETHGTWVSKGKGRVVPELFLNKYYAMKAYWGSGGIESLILSPRH